MLRMKDLHLETALRQYVHSWDGVGYFVKIFAQLVIHYDNGGLINKDMV